MAIDDNTSYELTGAQVKDLASKIKAKADTNSLATVATSGSYADLSNKPTIPTVSDGTLTIQHNGTTKGTFTANQSTAATVNIETIYADDYISTSPIPTTVTTAMIEDGAVTAAKTAFGGNYSTTEVDTGFTWIDGKHIYKKTIDFGALPNNTGKSIAHNITGISRVVKIEAIMYQGANSWAIPYVSVSSISVEGSNVVIYTKTNLTAFSAFVTVYCTKS